MSRSLSSMRSILVVGGGVTSAATCSLLTQSLTSPSPSEQPFDLTVWDKARGAGGRMSTTRSAKNANCTADLGAQYISTSPEDFDRHGEIYTNLLSQKILVPMDAEISGMREDAKAQNHFAAPTGISSVVKHLFANSRASLRFQHHVNSVELDTKTKKWIVSTQHGATGEFDSVVLTMPVPQVLQLPGVVQKVMESNATLRDALEKVTYSSRYALGYFYDTPLQHNFEADAKYIADEVIRFMAVDNAKRGRRDKSTPTSLVFHTSVEFGKDHVETMPDEVKPLLMKRVSQLYPTVPAPEEVKCHKWRYSQVTVPFRGQPGCLVLNEDPLLLLGGDAFAHSNFNGCLDSSKAIVKTLLSAW